MGAVSELVVVREGGAEIGGIGRGAERESNRLVSAEGRCSRCRRRSCSKKSWLCVVVIVALPLGSMMPDSGGDAAWSQKRMLSLRERRTSKSHGSSICDCIDFAPQLCVVSVPVMACVPSEVPGSCAARDASDARERDEGSSASIFPMPNDANRGNFEA